MPRSASRIVIGSGVPQPLSMNSRLLTKYASAVKGVLPLVPSFRRSIRSGMLAVLMTCLPGSNTSSALPSRKKIATWLSRTMTFEPNRKSPAPRSGIRWTISFPVSSTNSTTSMMRGIVFSLHRCEQRLLAFQIQLVDRRAGRDQVAHARAGVARPADRRRKRIDRQRDLVRFAEQLRIPMIQLLQLVLVDLDGVEKAGVTARRRLDAVDEGVQPDHGPLDVVDVVYSAFGHQLHLQVRSEAHTPELPSQLHL